ncbi:NADPH2:quinone reductase, partial [Mesorhizobium tianshanense]
MTDARKVIVEKPGGPEVMSLVSENVPPPKEGEVTIRQTAIGFNFIDIYQ